MPRFAPVICLILAGLVPMAAAAEDRRLTVTGEGRVASVPDMATITLGVTAEAKTAAEALDATSVAVAAVLDELRAAGIEPRDLQTSGLTLGPVYDNRSYDKGGPQIVGFQASNQVSVRVRELASLGGVLDTVVERGANTFQGLSFGLQEPGPVQDAARRAAVADGLRKAQLYAEAAGVALGDLVQLDEAGTASPRPSMMMERSVAAADAVPVAEGEVETRATVNMVFALGE